MKRILFLVLAVLGALCSRAQENEPREHEDQQMLIGLQPVRGKFYYVIEDLRTGRVVQRGVSETQGGLHQGLLLPANRRFREGILHARTLKAGFSEFTTPGAGQRFRLPSTSFLPANDEDSDGDGLSDLGEFIVGTNPNLPDSDGDGLRDGVEVQQDTNPLDGAPLATGLLAAARVDGTALDVDALNGTVAVATGERGVAIFAVGLGFTPTLIRQVPTPGAARRVALADGFAVAATGGAGLAVLGLDVDSGPRRIPLGEGARESATAVAAANRLAFAGTSEGSLFVVQLDLESVLQRETLGSPVQDVKWSGDLLLAVTGQNGAFSPRTLHLFRLEGSVLVRESSLALGNFGPEGLTASSRISAGNGLAYISAFVGFDVVDISNPAAPRVVAAARDQNPNSFKQMVANGSGLGIAAVGINPGSAVGHDVWVYDLRDPADNTGVRAVLPMPDRVRALALYNGLAYAAASGAGLLVVNYESPDTQGTAPTLRLETSFLGNVPPVRAEEGKLERLTAVVTDDVQVRDVQFFVDGVRVATDGNFPFETRFVTPVRTVDRTRFEVHAVARDTGGNIASSPVLIVELVPDATPPRVSSRHPAPDRLYYGDFSEAAVGFTEPIRAADVAVSQFVLAQAATDGALGSPEEQILVEGRLVYLEDARLLVRQRVEPLGTGRYEIRLLPPVRDLAGNAIADPVSWRFTVIRPGDLDGVDSDGDGVSDLVESILGLDPANSADARQDPDRDGLGTDVELRLGLHPLQRDSDGNGVSDADEDLDQDGLSNLREVQLGTDPLEMDTDGDGWPDEAEVTGGSDPLRSASVPVLSVLAQPGVELIAPGTGFQPGVRLGMFLAQPTVEVIAPDAVFGANSSFGPTLAQPRVEILAPAVAFDFGVRLGPTLASPVAEILLPTAAFGAGSAFGPTLAAPPLEMLLPSGIAPEGMGRGATLANPPVTLLLPPP